MRTLRIVDARLTLQQADITSLQVEAIVNAANPGLAGGGGVDGAIHRAGGPSIMEECRRIGGCPTGSAVRTGAGSLAAKYVIHAVAPIFADHERDAALLRGAYQKSLEIAHESGVLSVAFPSLGTGAYGYPIKLAAPVALSTVVGYLRKHGTPREVTFALFSESDLLAYSDALEAMIA